MGEDALMRLLSAFCLLALALLIAAPAEAQLSVSSGQCTITAAGGTGAKTCAHGNSSTPVLVIWYGNDVASGTAAGQDGRFLWGASASSTEECAIAGHFQDGSGTMNTTSGTFTTASIVRMAATDTVDAAADFTSFDATNLNFNVSNAPAADFTVQFITFAGTGLSVDVGIDTVTTGTGAQSFTSASFQGSLIIAARARGAAGASDAGGASSRYSIGVATSSTSRATVAQVALDAADADTKSMWDDDNLLIGLDTTGAVQHSFDFTQFNSDGYTINKTVSNGGNTDICRVIMGGTNFSAAIGTEAQRTTGGTTTISGLGHTPEAALFFIGQGITEDTVQDGWKSGIGSAAGVATMRVAAMASNDGSASEESSVSTINTKVMRAIAAGDGSTLAEADLDSFGSGQMVVDWTTADAAARRYIYVTMENSAPAGSGQPPSSLLLMGVGAQ